MKKKFATVVSLVASLVVVVAVASPAQTYTGSRAVVGDFTAQEGSVAGGVNVMEHGAKCDNSTDDTSAIQNAINAALAGNQPIIFPGSPSGTPGSICIVSQLDFTNWANKIHVYGQSGLNTGGLIIHCKESVNDTGVCMDFTGSQYLTISNLRVEADAVSPQALIRFGKASPTAGRNSNGNSQLIYTENLTTNQVNGDYSIYNNGGEVWTSVGDNFNNGNVAVVALSASATPAVASPFATLTGSIASMTEVQFVGLALAGSGNQALLLDYGSGGSIGSISIFGGFGAHASGKPWMADRGSGTTKNFTMFGFRDEPQSSNPFPLISVTQNIYGVHISGEYAAEATSTQPLFSFGTVGEGIINMVPGDNSSFYPNAMINCTYGFGLMVWSYNLKYSCPGIVEVATANSGPGTIVNFPSPFRLGGSTPTANAGSINAHSTNTGGVVTGLSGATSLTITFASPNPWTTAIFCEANASAALTSSPWVSSLSLTFVTFSFSALTGSVYYHCDGF